MNFRSKRPPVGCVDPRRIARHVAGPSAGFAVAVLIGFFQPAAAQTATLTNGGVATGAISCAPSANGTGHMVCLEYSEPGTLIGLSWQAPPTSAFVPAPAPATTVNGKPVPAVVAGEGTETVGTVDVVTLATPGGTLVGAPGCAPENNDIADTSTGGTTACLVVVETTSGSFAIQGIAFYPPTDNAGTATPSGLMTLATEPANTKIGNPSCAAANQTVTVNGTTGGAVVCAITVNGQLMGVGFEPMTQVKSALTSLLPGASVTGNPSCTSQEAANPSVCAVREGNSLVGFALTFTPPPSGTTATIAAPAGDVISLGSMTFAGDPSCTIPNDGTVGTTSYVATCGIVSGTTLFGLSFDPIDAIPGSSPSSHTTAFQSLGTAPDTGSWTGSIGCSSFPDFKRTLVGPNQQLPHQNLIGCAAISSTSNVFEVTFDPRMPVDPLLPVNPQGGPVVIGPFGSNAANANLSCLPLAIDQDNFYCGGTTTTGASAGYLIPVGILSPAIAAVLAQFLSN